MHGRALAALLAIAVLALLAGCSPTDGATAQPSPSPTDTEQSTPSPSPSPSPDAGSFAVDWTGSFALSLPNGWSVQDCEGDRLDACVYDGDVMLGDVELLSGYPLDERQTGQAEATVLAELASGFLEHFREDRAAGCPDFDFVADDVRDATVGGQPAKRAAFSLLDSNGQVVERVINHFTLQGDSYAIVNTDAYATEGGCLGPSEYDASFTPANLATMEEYLDRLVEESPLPATPTS